MKEVPVIPSEAIEFLDNAQDLCFATTWVSAETMKQLVKRLSSYSAGGFGETLGRKISFKFIVLLCIHGGRRYAHLFGRSRVVAFESSKIRNRCRPLPRVLSRSKVKHSRPLVPSDIRQPDQPTQIYPHYAFFMSSLSFGIVDVAEAIQLCK
ncbi:hypothetical protein BDV38DRAFT_106757 [Aspergillus pseudotamarii]|uniref:Uncharacterized protein n=1 Tax=Aspergillus pseudotamarii TaxID=132259 RepID=A0A5N6SU59_ASPPS|nr:uncharacterized protein BDV38DRAFT_106757 [Aspergillus pseudotamarii]KAE8136933.1 hypothetical protein BDV38DRAFT_106757 [Aspergillus pseudotamarii]